MSKIDDIINKAAGEVGYYAPNDPEPGSKYGRWMADMTGERWLAGPSRTVWWCAIFVSWVFNGIQDTGGVLPSYNCDQIRTRARGRGLVLSNKRDARRGDIVLFDWNGNGSLDHVGIVVANNGNSLSTIEGNTSGSDWGSQSAGNGVHRRTRSWGTIACVVRPPYAESPSSPTVPATNGIEVDGYWGPATTKRAQEIAGLVNDGEVWHQWSGNRGILSGCTGGWKWDRTETGSPLIRYMQRNVLGIYADGLAGRDFANAMIRKYGNNIQDGRLDGPSVAIRGFQRSLNSGRF